MLNVYKKIEKNSDNYYGIVEIENIDDLNKPFLLCLSAQNNNDKSIYGIIKEGAEAARVYTTEEVAAGFKIDEMPIDFLGVRFKSDEQFQENYQEIVDKLIYPYLMRFGKDNKEALQRQANNINFMTYCDGTETYVNIERLLEEKLKSDGFTNEEIDSLIVNISLTAIGTMVDTSNLKCSSVTFIDVNDDEIATEHTEAFKEILDERNIKSKAGYLKNKNNLYIFKGSGNHDLKEYLKDETIAKPALCAVVSNYLECSIKNEAKNSEKTLISYGNEKIVHSELLNILDNELSYNNTPRYTENEIVLRQSLDIAYKELAKNKLQIERLELQNKKKDTTLNAVLDNIKTFSSEVTEEQILTSSGLWQPSDEKDIFSLPSDKDVRLNYDEAITKRV